MARKKKATKQKNQKFSKLLPHNFACSDLSRSFFKGKMFSCSACDDWNDTSLHERGKMGEVSTSTMERKKAMSTHK
jgi:hypothetical protein